MAPVPEDAVPLASVPSASVPLASVPLDSASVPLASVPLAPVPLASVPLAAVRAVNRLAEDIVKNDEDIALEADLAAHPLNVSWEVLLAQPLEVSMAAALVPVGAKVPSPSPVPLAAPVFSASDLLAASVPYWPQTIPEPEPCESRKEQYQNWEKYQ